MLKEPFNTVLKANRCVKMLPRWDGFRTFRWADYIKNIELTLNLAQELLI